MNTQTVIIPSIAYMLHNSDLQNVFSDVQLTALTLIHMQGLSHRSVVIISTVNKQDEVSGHAEFVVSSKWVCTEVSFYCTWADHFSVLT